MPWLGGVLKLSELTIPFIVGITVTLPLLEGTLISAKLILGAGANTEIPMVAGTEVPPGPIAVKVKESFPAKPFAGV